MYWLKYCSAVVEVLQIEVAGVHAKNRKTEENLNKILCLFGLSAT